MRSVILEASSPVLRRELFAATLNLPGFGTDGELSLRDYLAEHGDKPWNMLNLTPDSGGVEPNYYSRQLWRGVMALGGAYNMWGANAGLLDDAVSAWNALHAMTERAARPILLIENRGRWVDIRNRARDAITADLTSIGLDGEALAATVYRASEWSNSHTSIQRIYALRGVGVHFSYPYANSWAQNRYVQAIRRVVI